MLDENRQCPHLATEAVAGKGYCGQHVGTVYRTEAERSRKAALVEAMNRRIDAALAYHIEQPSVWDLMPFAVAEYDFSDVWWNGQSGIGVHVPTGTFVIERDDVIVEWEGPYQ
jgi:hypothetical protein